MKVTITIVDKGDGVKIECSFSEPVTDETRSPAVTHALEMLNKQFPNARPVGSPQ